MSRKKRSLNLDFDFDKMRDLSQTKFIKIQQHPEEDLLLFNYTPHTQYNNHWTAETLCARGLITDLEGNIVARPFPKFFNLNEYDDELPELPFEVYEKMDGSLGIIYFVNGEARVATRGSFESDQAKYAMNMLREMYSHVQFNPAITYLVEIIYPENKIVVNYGDRRQLVLIGMIETASGVELPLEDIGLPVVKKYDGLSTDIHSLSSLNESNKEGFVVRYSNGLRLKVKFEEYKRLHKLMTSVSERTIWKLLSNGDSMNELLENVPDELYNWVDQTVQKFQQEFKKIQDICKKEYKVLGNKKQTSAYFREKCTYPSVLFLMLKGQKNMTNQKIWQLIKP